MQPKRSGGCQCGKVRYRIPVESLGLAICHCTECQRQSGSAFGMSLDVDVASFELTTGELSRFEVTCDSGRLKTCAFCPDCGVRIYHLGADGSMSIKAGTLDDRSNLLPDAHYWTQSKQRWVSIPDHVSSYPDDD